MTIFPEAHSKCFSKLLNVFQNLNNSLLIQIVVNEKELSEECINKPPSIARETEKEMYLIIYNNMLDETIGSRLTGYMNKFLAPMFNAFEECIFVDEVAVIFLNPEEVFYFAEYKSARFYITRDREVHDDSSQDVLMHFLD